MDFIGPGFHRIIIIDYDPEYQTLSYLLSFESIFYLNALLNPIIYAWMNKDFNQCI